MDVSQAVDQRMSCRAFLDTPVPDDIIRSLLDKARRAPSGGNVQPWRIYVLNGEVMERFKTYVAERDIEPPCFEIYPAGLWEPHRTARFELGEDMYATLNIGREDKAGRFARIAENFKFFGAPAAIFCFLDKRMLPPQWSDVGMFLQTFMLLAEEAGLSTCPQEIWCQRGEQVRTFVGAPEDEQVFCAIAIGHKDADHPVNTLRAKRIEVDDFASWVS